MLSEKILEAHYAEYAAQPDQWVQNMEVTKKSIVEYVFNSVSYKHNNLSVKIAVLGASDSRYIPIHKRMNTTGLLYHI